MLISFKLTMPNRGSWNGKWGGEENLYAIVKKFSKSEILDFKINQKINRDFYYSWEDGWTACVDVIKVDSKEAVNIRKHSKGFRGYDWMINSILKLGYIDIDINRKALI